MRLVWMKRAGLALSWAAVAVWFGSAAFHLALHPEHGHAHGGHRDAHDHGQCHGHSHGSPLELAPDTEWQRSHPHRTDTAGHGTHECALCALANTSVVSPSAAAVVPAWQAAPNMLAAQASALAPQAEYLPQSRRGPPVSA